MDGLQSYNALVLNADYRPLSTYPLSSLSWEKSVRSALAGKAIVVAEYARSVRSARQEIALPSVLVLKDYVDLRRPAPLNKLNLMLRDRLHCVYCGGRFASSELTFDHLVPRAKGGRSVWDNLVAACHPCNQRKGDKTPEQVGMVLRSKPYRPTLAQLNAIGTEMTELRDIPKTWRDWLYWTTSIDP